MKEARIHLLFEAGVLIKGINGLVECVSGTMLALTSNSAITAVVERLTRRGLDEDSRFFRQLIGWAHGFSAANQHFFAFYLLAHGIIKLVFVVGLLREKRWAYPVSLVALAVFMAYQLVRYTHTHALGLLFLTAFDLGIFMLVWHEYRLVRHHQPTH